MEEKREGNNEADGGRGEGEGEEEDGKAVGLTENDDEGEIVGWPKSNIGDDGGNDTKGYNVGDREASKNGELEGTEVKIDGTAEYLEGANDGLPEEDNSEDNVDTIHNELDGPNIPT